jgi:hypothetical protein
MPTTGFEISVDRLPPLEPTCDSNRNFHIFLTQFLLISNSRQIASNLTKTTDRCKGVTMGLFAEFFRPMVIFNTLFLLWKGGWCNGKFPFL